MVQHVLFLSAISQLFKEIETVEASYDEVKNFSGENTSRTKQEFRTEQNKNSEQRANLI